MLIAVPLEKLAEAQAILDRFEAAHSVVGSFTDSRRFHATWRDEKVVDLEMPFLWEACPLDTVSVAEPKRRLEPINIREPRTEREWATAMERVLTHYHCADQSAAGSRFDTTVQGRTAVGPYGGKNHRMPTNLYVSAPLRGKPYGVVATVAINPFYGEVNPAAMAKLMMIEAITKAVVAGADYREMVLCDNFYTPRVRPEIAWDLKQMVEAIADFSTQIRVPFISGKDSSSGTFETVGPLGERRTIDVPPTLAVAALARVPDVKKIVTKEFKGVADRIVLVGRADPEALGGSVYADAHFQRGDRLFDAYDAASICALWDALLELHRSGTYVSGSAVAEGGVALRLFEGCYGSGLGICVTLDGPVSAFGARRRWPEDQPANGVTERRHNEVRRDGLLFGEFIGSALIEVPPDSDLGASLDRVPHCIIGKVTAEPRLVLTEAGQVLWEGQTSALAESWARTFREVVE